MHVEERRKLIEQMLNCWNEIQSFVGKSLLDSRSWEPLSGHCSQLEWMNSPQCIMGHEHFERVSRFDTLFNELIKDINSDKENCRKALSFFNYIDSNFLFEICRNIIDRSEVLDDNDRLWFLSSLDFKQFPCSGHLLVNLLKSPKLNEHHRAHILERINFRSCITSILEIQSAFKDNILTDLQCNRVFSAFSKAELIQLMGAAPNGTQIAIFCAKRVSSEQQKKLEEAIKEGRFILTPSQSIGQSYCRLFSKTEMLPEKSSAPKLGVVTNASA